jgi:hypothetical protein
MKRSIRGTEKAVDGIIFSSDVGNPEVKIPKAKHKNFKDPSALLDKKAFSYNADTRSDIYFLNYMTFLSQNGTTELPASTLHIPACKNLKGVVDIDTRKPFEISSNGVTAADIYVLRFQNNTSSFLKPLLCSNIMDTNEKFESGETNPAFVEAPLIHILVDGRTWNLRDPNSAAPESRTAVIDNWQTCIFSSNEAAFLNHINLSPRLLGTVFQSDIWKKELAGFMNNMVSSNCFDDVTLLSRGNCEESRVFLTKVYNYIFASESLKDNDIDIPRLALPPLPSGQTQEEIVWPPELEDIPDAAFDLGTLGSIQAKTDTGSKLPSYFIDFIVVHKKTFRRSPRRLRLDYNKVESDALENEVIFSEIIEDLKEDYPDFFFIY